MAVDDLPDLCGIKAGNFRQLLNGVLEVLGVLANDGNGEGMTVVDQNFAVAIEQHATRSTQRQRPLVIVLRHFDVLLPLYDLQNPEADRQRRKDRDHGNLQHHQPAGNTSSILSYRHNCYLRDGTVSRIPPYLNSDSRSRSSSSSATTLHHSGQRL